MDAERISIDMEREFRRLKVLADRAMVQLDEERFFGALDEEGNSVAVIVKHLTGNLQSRWRDFLTTDGEKPDRNRDGEFQLTGADTRQALLERWDAAWEILFATLRALEPADLEATVTIRGEPHSVPQAVFRHLTHYAYHVGQLVLLARHWKGPAWRTLSVPRGGSVQFNANPRSYLASP